MTVPVSCSSLTHPAPPGARSRRGRGARSRRAVARRDTRCGTGARHDSRGRRVHREVGVSRRRLPEAAGTSHEHRVGDERGRPRGAASAPRSHRAGRCRLSPGHGGPCRLLWLSERTDGSLLSMSDRTVGNRLIRQAFTDADGNRDPRSFQSRPSAVGDAARRDLAPKLGVLVPPRPHPVSRRRLAPGGRRCRLTHRVRPADPVTAHRRPRPGRGLHAHTGATWNRHPSARIGDRPSVAARN